MENTNRENFRTRILELAGESRRDADNQREESTEWNVAIDRYMVFDGIRKLLDRGLSTNFLKNICASLMAPMIAGTPSVVRQGRREAAEIVLLELERNHL